MFGVMRVSFGRLIVFSICTLFLIRCAQAEPTPDDGQIKNSAALVRQHVEQIIKKLPQASNSYGKRIATQAKNDANSASYQGNSGTVRGAKEHPWKQIGNPNSYMDWIIDSSLMKLYHPINFPNIPKIHGCWEFGLLGKSTTSDGSDFRGTSFEPAVCQSYCLASSILFFWEGHAPPWAMVPWLIKDNRNGMETAMYWFPEYQVATNNYGVNRINPALLGQPLFTNQGLLSAKASNDLKKAEIAGQSYPYNSSQFRVPPELQRRPFAGQGWAGFYFPDFQEKRYSHIYRTEFSVGKSDLKKKTTAGWRVDPAFSLLDSFPPKSSEHAPINVWTEYGMFDLVSGIPHLSRNLYGGIGNKLMTALYGPQQSISEAAKQTPPFWQSQGAMAYRVKKWPQIYGDLSNLYQIQGGGDPSLKEVVFKGGYELYPLVSNLEGFGTPTLAAAAIIARRGLYLAGENKTMLQFYPKNVPNPRIMQYTINALDRSREIDKMQRLRPLKPPWEISECFRSQNIPNMVNVDKSLEFWAEQNFPRDLLKYTMDRDLFSIQGNDVSFAYWNRRISCHCEYVGLITGSWTMDDGDKLYDIPKMPLCTYPPGSSFSAWQGTDTFSKCVVPQAQFNMYRGLNDAF